MIDQSTLVSNRHRYSTYLSAAVLVCEDIRVECHNASAVDMLQLDLLTIHDVRTELLLRPSTVFHILLVNLR